MPRAAQTIDDLLGPAEPPAGPSIQELLDSQEPPAAPRGSEWGPGLEALNAPLLGFGPEIAAAGYGLAHGAQTGFVPAYREGLATVQAARDQYLATNPLQAGAIDLAGSAPTVGLLAAATPEIPGAAALAATGRLGQSAATVARGAALGAEAGGLETKLTGGGLGQNIIQGAIAGTALSGLRRGAQVLLAHGQSPFSLPHVGPVIQGGLAGGLAGVIAEHGPEVIGHMASADPMLAAKAAALAIATAGSIGGFRALRGHVLREALGFAPTDWQVLLANMARSGAVGATNVVGAQPREQSE